MFDPHPLVCRFGAFGDMVMLTPLLKQLHERSGLPCDVIAIGSWNQPLFEQMPYVRQVFSIDSRTRPYWVNRSQRNLVQTLREHQHRHIWICETNARSYRLLARVGIHRSNSINQLDQTPVPGEHYCEKWLRLGNESPPGFDQAQSETTEVDPELFVSSDEVEACRNWLKQREIDPQVPIVCIQAGSKRTTRRGSAARASNTKYWHERNWAAVIDGVLAGNADAQVLLCGVPAEAAMCQAILARCGSQDRVTSVATDLPMRRLLALLSIAHSCISVDTGPAHAAAALNCPLAVLFGKADPKRFRPVSKQSEVAVIIGRAEESKDSETDINLITPDQVMCAWEAVTK
jgi:ADP-heptose:LPS heptosyltransferase